MGSIQGSYGMGTVTSGGSVMKDFNVLDFMIKFEDVMDNEFRTDDSFLLAYAMRLLEIAVEAK